MPTNRDELTMKDGESFVALLMATKRRRRPTRLRRFALLVSLNTGDECRISFSWFGITMNRFEFAE